MFVLTSRAKALLVALLVMILGLLGALTYQVRLEVQKLEASKPVTMIVTKEVIVTPTATPSAMLKKVVVSPVKTVVPSK